MRWALLLVMVGCNYPPKQCESSIGPVHSDVAINCKLFQQRIDLARTVANDMNALPAPLFNMAVERGAYQVVVYDTEIFDCPAGSCLGQFKPLTGELELGHDGLALLHELFHAWDTRIGYIEIPMHAGWDKNGFQAADDAYEALTRTHLVTL